MSAARACSARGAQGRCNGAFAPPVATTPRVTRAERPRTPLTAVAPAAVRRALAALCKRCEAHWGTLASTTLRLHLRHRCAHHAGTAAQARATVYVSTLAPILVVAAALARRRRGMSDYGFDDDLDEDIDGDDLGYDDYAEWEIGGSADDADLEEIDADAAVDGGLWSSAEDEDFSDSDLSDPYGLDEGSCPMAGLFARCAAALHSNASRIAACERLSYTGCPPGKPSPALFRLLAAAVCPSSITNSGACFVGSAARPQRCSLPTLGGRTRRSTAPLTPRSSARSTSPTRACCQCTRLPHTRRRATHAAQAPRGRPTPAAMRPRPVSQSSIMRLTCTTSRWPR